MVIAIPGGIFGEGDKSALAQAMRDVARGKLPLQIATSSRFQLCHAAHVADGLVRMLERGRVGESYVLTGEAMTMPELLGRVARLAKQKIPKAVAPVRMVPVAWFADALAQLGVVLPLSREALAVMDGSTYTYRADKAQRDLGFDAGDFSADLERYVASLR